MNHGSNVAAYARAFEGGNFAANAAAGDGRQYPCQANTIAASGKHQLISPLAHRVVRSACELCKLDYIG